MGRVQSAARNIVFGYIGNLTTQILGFVLRSIFIAHLGDTLNGVNDLYTSLLSVLSMAELGVGTALNYSLYGPVARKDYEKIKSYMLLYRKAYRVIGLVIGAAGLLVSPFLPYLVKQPEGVSVRDMTLYYFIFLFNTVSSYFVAYKYSLVNAEQKNYIQTNVITVTKMITVTLQIGVILATRNFYLYLLTAAFVELIQKIFVSDYLNRRYPYLKDRNVARLSREETGEVVQKTKALMFHKIGDVARLQTDSMIISSFINVTLVGYVGNYNMILTSVSNFVNIIFNSVLSSFGNLIATESKDKQYQMFRIYRFFACWIYGFSAVGFFLLLTPLIILWPSVGPGKTLPATVVGLILTDYYFKGDRIVLSNFKTAAGVFEQDKYLALLQGAVNLVISIALVQKIGLSGVYVGTIVSGLIANVTKPFIIYKACFDRDARAYFVDSVKYLTVILGILAVLAGVKSAVLQEITVWGFAGMFVLVVIVFNGVFLLLFGRTEEFGYLWGIVRKKLGKGQRP